MGGGKLPPRQKMIGMMYLVLTALLAMNISKDILNAFVMINDSLEATNITFGSKNDVAYSAFDKAYAENKDKVKKYWDKANEAKKLSKELIDHIDQIKFKLIRATDKIDPSIPDDSLSLTKVEAKDDYGTPTNILIGSEPASPRTDEFSANELKLKIESFRGKMLELIDEKYRSNMNIGLVLEGANQNGVNVGWEVLNFDHTPLAATVTILSKLQTDIRNAESDIVKALFSEVDAGDFKFDVVVAKVIPQSNYVILGDSFKADIFVAAYSSTQNPEVLVGELDTVSYQFKGDPSAVNVNNGIGKFSRKSVAEGPQTVRGIINIKAPDGTVKPYPFKTEYMVAKGGVVVSPTKMNVLYIGVDNPLDISVSGIAAENIVPTLAGGTLSGSRGKYIARVQSGVKATVNVSAKIGSATTSMGSAEFRVKRVPDPVAMFAGKKGAANISRSDLTTALGVIADLENFDFDLKFKVLEFDITATIGGFEQNKTSKSNMITEEQKSLLKSVKPGAKVYIENIKVKGEDGTIRTLSPINLKVM
ncbi:MAG: gliding motility protein GldM [Bacteroidetes bacterium]|nr:gliding motility protein GldM [Bacteroidota bacterium]HET6243243.1 gliding motility protein GldM [Bacteroidia bacterium]